MDTQPVKVSVATYWPGSGRLMFECIFCDQTVWFDNVQPSEGAVKAQLHEHAANCKRSMAHQGQLIAELFMLDEHGKQIKVK